MKALKYFEGWVWCRNLLSSGMSLALTGEQVVVPDILTLRRVPFGASGCSAGIGDAVPIFRRICDSPNISLVVQRYSDQEVFCVRTQRQTIRDAAGCASAAWQVAQQHWGFDRQSLRRANPTALRTYHQSDTLRRQWMPPVHTGDDQRNLYPQSRATPCRLGCEDFHLRDSSFTNILV